jgi:hypothetical protein
MIVPANEKEIPKMWLAVVQDRIQSIFGNKQKKIIHPEKW